MDNPNDAAYYAQQEIVRRARAYSANVDRQNQAERERAERERLERERRDREMSRGW